MEGNQVKLKAYEKGNPARKIRKILRDKQMYGVFYLRKA